MDRSIAICLICPRHVPCSFLDSSFHNCPFDFTSGLSVHAYVYDPFSEARTPSSLLWLTFDELVFLLAFFVACFRVGITSDASLDLLGGITLQTSEDDVRRKSSGSLHMNTTDPAAAAIRIFYG